MERLPEFIGNHLFLVTAFMAVAGLLIWNLSGAGIKGLTQIGPLQAVGLMNHENALVVDVRESNEYNQGHVIDSLHIPLGSLENHLNILEKHKDRPLIMSCQSGHRSLQACRTLYKKGFEKLYNMQGGVSAWQHAGLPLTTSKKTGGKKVKNK